jgi:hypothetical protein
MADLEAGEIGTATQRLETMATRLLNLGETDLARAALLEAEVPVIFRDGVFRCHCGGGAQVIRKGRLVLAPVYNFFVFCHEK